MSNHGKDYKKLITWLKKQDKIIHDDGTINFGNLEQIIVKDNTINPEVGFENYTFILEEIEFNRKMIRYCSSLDYVKAVIISVGFEDELKFNI